ncbi:hypothetical protein AB6N23_01075 [Cellulomonas sp. 179-A 9B4 NHS]|uniref:hypothetical protein n=1 Tax=Cellulomonas sp. 179-A 9B4 NHS TaxID=3142379 RepID=UPI0039A22DAB
MSAARRVGAVALLAVALQLGAPAAARAAAYDDALATAWDGPTVHLAWDGTTYASSTTSFVGSQVAVPGDVAGRTLTVRNDGPTDAMLRGWVTDVRLLDPDAPDLDPWTGASLGDFYSDLTLAWRTASDDGSASFRALAARERTPVVEVPLARGASTQVTVVSAFPVEATSGNGANVAPREARFSVLLELAGRPGAGPGEPTAAPTGDPGPAPTPGGAGSDGRGGPVAATGATGSGVAVATDPLATTGAEALRLALVAVTAVGAGGLLLGAVRRRREER